MLPTSRRRPGRRGGNIERPDLPTQTSGDDHTWKRPARLAMPRGELLVTAGA